MGATVESPFDIVILHGRVMDPATNFTGLRNIGIRRGKIAAITRSSLHGTQTIDASGLVVSPGFIDLHEHGQDFYNQTFKARDGVTSALDLEGGTFDLDRWYKEREGKSLINFGSSVSFSAARVSAFEGAAAAESFVGPAMSTDLAHRRATDTEITMEMEAIERGVARGAPAIGLGIAYVPSTTHEEVRQLFALAATNHILLDVHMRFTGGREPDSVIDSIDEVLADAEMTGASLHIAHISGMALGQSSLALQMIGDARHRGLDVSTEAYPYTAAMTDIASAVFDPGWKEMFGIDYGDLQWTSTGERLTEQSFDRYRKVGGMVVIHAISEQTVTEVLRNPLVMIASDGLLQSDGTGHPRGAGSYARALGHYVREQNTLSLMEALRRMTIMPARRLEARIPAMRRKGRIEIGADADLTVFNPAIVEDGATFEHPAIPSLGIPYVLVGGVVVVSGGKIVDGVVPGQAIRAPMH